MFATLALGLMLQQAAAPSAADLADAKCAGAMLTVSGQLKEPAEKAGVDGMMMFYIGKIIGRSGATAVRPALEAAAALLDAVALPQLAESCATEGQKAMDSM